MSGLNEQKQKEYEEYVKEVTPVNNVWMDVLKAFLTGGLICVFSQGISNWLTGGLGLEKDAASAWVLITLIGLSILATGLGLYPKLVKFGGAGALVPITGFANSVVSPAIEYKAEGHVFGIGCKIFTIAGPVILFGVFTSWVLGVIYWMGSRFFT